MHHDILMGLPRTERRLALNKEARARKTGEWGAWERHPVPLGFGRRGGWTSEVTHAWKNRVFAVLDRPLCNGGRHLAITSLSQVRPTWWEMQRIKNEIGGEAAIGVEIYPPAGEVIDEADMFHLWIVSEPMLHYSIFLRSKLPEGER